MIIATMATATATTPSRVETFMSLVLPSPV